MFSNTFYEDDYDSTRRGLQNIGNTCFLNTGLQCMASVVSLSNFFLCKFSKSHLSQAPDKLSAVEAVRAFRKFLSHIVLSDESSAFSPQELKTCIAGMVERFQGYEQHDAFDWMTTLLNKLVDGTNQTISYQYKEEDNDYYEKPEEERLKYTIDRLKNRYNSKLVDIFYFYQKSITKCKSCMTERYRFQSYTFLSVPIRRNLRYRVIVLDAESPYFLLDNRDGSSMRTAERKCKGSPTSMTFEFVLTHSTEMNVRKLRSCLDDTDVHIEGEFFVYKRGALQRVSEEDDLLDKWTYILVPKSLLVEGHRLKVHEIEILFTEYRQYYGQAIRESRQLELFHLESVPDGRESRVDEKALLNKLFPLNLDGTAMSVNYNRRTQYDTMNGELVETSRIAERITVDVNVSVKETLSLLYEAFNSHCVEKILNGRNGIHLSDCIEDLSAESPLAQGSEWKCSQCNATRDCVFQTKIHTIPRVVQIHLRRFERGGDHGEMDKIHETVKFDENMKFPTDDKHEYKLVAVGCHAGRSLNSGHCYAFCRSIITDDWYRCDDSFVKRVDVEHVLNHENAIVLIYERNDGDFQRNKEEILTLRNQLLENRQRSTFSIY